MYYLEITDVYKDGQLINVEDMQWNPIIRAKSFSELNYYRIELQKYDNYHYYRVRQYDL